MTYRISTAQLAKTGLDGILKNQATMSDLMSQISSGKRNDLDPVEKSQQLDYTVKLSNNAQNIRNGETILPRMSSQEKALGGITEKLIQLQETMISATNPATYNKETTQINMDAIKNDILDLVNTKDASGNYLFSGYAGQTKPFSNLSTYSGDNGVRQIRIGDSTFVDENVLGSNVITKNVVDAFDKLQTFINTGVNDPTMLDAVQKSLSDVSLQQTKVGLNMNKIDNWKELNNSIGLNTQERLSQIEDADMASLITQLSSAKNASEASLKSYAVIQNLSLFNYI